MKALVRLGILVLVAEFYVLLPGCGNGGSAGNSGGKTQSTPTLQSIAITPANVTLNAGQTQQLTATATLSDGSTQDVTNSAIWSSSNPSIATVSNAGLAAAVSAGTDTITASLSGVTGSAGLMVSAKALTAVKVLPQGLTLYLGSAQQFEAIGSYNDGSTADITGSVSWSSSTPGSASISAAGVASALAAGSTTITASSANMSGSSMLTVSPNNSGFTVVDDITASRLVSFRDTDGSVVQYNGTRNANGDLSTITSAQITHPNGTSQTVLFDQQELPVDFRMSDGSEFAILWPSNAAPPTVTAFSSDDSFVFTAPFGSSSGTTAARAVAAAAKRTRQNLRKEQNAAAASDPSLVTVNVTSYDDLPENDATVDITESGTFLGGSIRADLNGNGVYQAHLPTGTSVPSLQTVDDLVQSTVQPLQSTCKALNQAELVSAAEGTPYKALGTAMCAGLSYTLDAFFPEATPASTAITTACVNLGVGLQVLDDVCQITGDASKVSQYLSSAATSVTSFFNGLPVDVTATAVLNFDSEPQTNKNQPGAGPFSPFNISVGSKDPIDKVQVTPSSLTLPIDASDSLTAGAYDSNSHLLRSSTFQWSWASDDENVAFVPASGVPVPTGTLQSVGLATVTATRNPGTANITATEQISGPTPGSAQVAVKGLNVSVAGSLNQIGIPSSSQVTSDGKTLLVTSFDSCSVTLSCSVSSGDGGLYTFSLSTPTSPAAEGHTSQIYAPYSWAGYYQVAYSGTTNTAFIADSQGYLQGFNLADPAAPAFIGAASTSCQAMSVVLSPDQTQAYVSDSCSRITQFNVTVPSSMTSVSQISLNGYQVDYMAISPDGKQLVMFGQRDVWVVDLSSGSLGAVTMSSQNSTVSGAPNGAGGFANGVYIGSRTVLLVGPSGATIFDLTNVSSPLVVGALTFKSSPVIQSLLAYSATYSDQTHLAYVLASGTFYVIDGYHPQNPVIEASATLPTTTKQYAAGLFSSVSTTPDGTTAFATEGGQLTIVNVQ
ncbi:Ig-like domain-containing protein [Acidipila rosea]|uniref:Ig-like protein group 2 n=1 Tax=Acidipila rosea TaxID=768535 RepID=A0A4R1LDW2_9BACT|nr:Ig-like domain-containing protein [Acidipila rosea]TCK75927.1 Ig-like protein group 2 [Acidipila rosea]